ncbi:MAG: hypothetical protein LBK53_05085 [Heliobacteriaceae bacterium]|jgi:hypothetical protein|nr:hypothetical protein [Heliobacteriaceae bacterium]
MYQILKQVQDDGKVVQHDAEGLFFYTSSPLYLFRHCEDECNEDTLAEQND